MIEFIRRSFLALGLVIGLVPVTMTTSAFAEEMLPQVAQWQVGVYDPVQTATTGSMTKGDPNCATVDTKNGVARWFEGPKSLAEYKRDPEKYSDPAPLQRVALFGVDATLLFPMGVDNPAEGIVAAGDPEIQTTWNGATYWFVNKEQRAKFFLQGPDKFTQVAVGGYCLGAMSRANGGDVVFGQVTDNHRLFIPEAGPTGTWALFGSERGPVTWAAMTPHMRRAAYELAVDNYRRKTGLDREGPARIAGR